MSFKAQIEKDLKTVFHNPNEHADVIEFWINDTRYETAVIIEDSEFSDRKKPSSDHVDGLSLIQLVMYVPLEAIEEVPKRGFALEMKGEIYNIAKVMSIAGEVILYLESLDE